MNSRNSVTIKECCKMEGSYNTACTMSKNELSSFERSETMFFSQFFDKNGDQELKNSDLMKKLLQANSERIKRKPMLLARKNIKEPSIQKCNIIKIKTKDIKDK